MHAMADHFFVSTLGDAQRINSANPHGITTINELLLRRARTTPDGIAVGMSIPQDGEKWGAVVYSMCSMSSALHECSSRKSVFTTLESHNCRNPSFIWGAAPGGEVERQESWAYSRNSFGKLVGYDVVLLWFDSDGIHGSSDSVRVPIAPVIFFRQLTFGKALHVTPEKFVTSW
jgi:hypothetical protein